MREGCARLFEEVMPLEQVQRTLTKCVGSVPGTGEGARGKTLMRGT